MQTILGIAALVLVAFVAFKLLFVVMHVLGWLFAIASAVICVLAIIDILMRRFSSLATKVVWLVVVLLTQGIGAVIYFLFGRQSGSLASRI